MDIDEGGTAEKTTVNSGGRMTVSSGGTAKDINIGYGAELRIRDGIVSGTIDLAGEISGSQPEPVLVNIDLLNRHIYDSFMVQDGEFFTNADWQITIDDKQAIGRYSIFNGYQEPPGAMPPTRHTLPTILHRRQA